MSSLAAVRAFTWALELVRIVHYCYVLLLATLACHMLDQVFMTLGTQNCKLQVV